MSTVRIPLNSRKHPGHFAIVDEEDYAELCRFQWYIDMRQRTMYASRADYSTGKLRILRMHRAILKPTQNQHIDHRDGDGLNNTRANLRTCTQGQNAKNQRLSTKNTSGYKGVYWNPTNLIWQAHIKAHGRTIHLGCYDDIVEAARAYDKAAREYYGEFAHPNFPD